MGYYFRQRHELLLIGKRGRGLSMPEPTDRPDSVIEAERGKHSEKPALVYEHLERMFPIATKVELFARTRRDGWAAWGNQA
jgi:N6-adenosine-specific RNA methylase IME4